MNTNTTSSTSTMTMIPTTTATLPLVGLAGCGESVYGADLRQMGSQAVHSHRDCVQHSVVQGPRRGGDHREAEPVARSDRRKARQGPAVGRGHDATRLGH